MKNYKKIFCLVLIIALVGAMTFLIKFRNNKYLQGNSMLDSIATQLSFGARNVGSPGRRMNQAYIKTELNKNNINTVSQSWQDSSGEVLENIIGRINPQLSNRIVLATHYDTRASADKDKKNPNAIMPGANDGASGVSLLLELGKLLKSDTRFRNLGVDLVFFDAEEFNPGSFENWTPKGSTYFTNNLEALYSGANPRLVINADMVCDKDLKFYKDPISVNAAPRAVEDIWAEGIKVDGKVFTDKIGKEIKDDSTPLVAAGIPTVLMIDLEYPYFHTTKDTLDKCSPKSLETTFMTLKNYLEKQK